jgi:hypothetical protein
LTSSVSIKNKLIFASPAGTSKRIIGFASIIYGVADSEVEILSIGTGGGNSAGVVDKSVSKNALSAGLGDGVKREAWQI